MGAHAADDDPPNDVAGTEAPVPSCMGSYPGGAASALCRELDVGMQTLGSALTEGERSGRPEPFEFVNFLESRNR